MQRQRPPRPVSGTLQRGDFCSGSHPEIEGYLWPVALRDVLLSECNFHGNTNTGQNHTEAEKSGEPQCSSGSLGGCRCRVGRQPLLPAAGGARARLAAAPSQGGKLERGCCVALGRGSPTPAVSDAFLSVRCFRRAAGSTSAPVLLGASAACPRAQPPGLIFCALSLHHSHNLLLIRRAPYLYSSGHLRTQSLITL